MADKKPPEQTTPEYDAWVASQASESDSDESEPRGENTSPDTSGSDDRLSRADVQKLIQEAREEERSRFATPLTLVPNNAGGVGVDDHAETWSQYDQELANRGEHPFQSQDLVSDGDTFRAK
jgi:hypothetical protein